MKNLFFWFLVIATPNTVFADTWVDKDRGTYVVLDDGVLSVHSTQSFYYFDVLFAQVRAGEKLTLCIGEAVMSETATDCLGEFEPSVGFSNEGKNRSLHFDVAHYPFIFSAYEEMLRDGKTLRLKIDDADLFAGYTLHKSNSLSAEAMDVLSLPE